MADKTIERLLSYLQDVFPQSIDADTAAAATGANINTVKGAFQRLVAREDAERTAVGYYKAKAPRKSNGAQ